MIYYGKSVKSNARSSLIRTKRKHTKHEKIVKTYLSILYLVFAIVSFLLKHGILHLDIRCFLTLFLTTDVFLPLCLTVSYLLWLSWVLKALSVLYITWVTITVRPCMEYYCHIYSLALSLYVSRSLRKSREEYARR